MSALPIASEIETVAAIMEESPAEVVMHHLEALEEKLDHIAKETLKEAYAEIAALKKALKKAVKIPRAKRSAAAGAVKGEAPKQVGAWNAFVKSTQDLMKASGWPTFEVTDKMGNTVSYPGGAEVEGKDGVSMWVVDADQPKKRVSPSYKLAMSYAAYRKATGDYEDPAAEEREAAKAAKAAEKEAAKVAKAAEREAKKAEKQKAQEEAKAAKAAEKEAKAAAKTAVAKTPAKPASKPTAKVAAAAKPVSKPAPKAAATAKPASKSVEEKPAAGGKSATTVAASEPAAAGGAGKKEIEEDEDEKPAAGVKEEIEEDEDDMPAVWTHNKKKYFKTPTSHMVWEMNGTKPGAWVGVYDPVKNTIDTSAEEPEYSFE